MATSAATSPFGPFLAGQGVVLLDGGLATELEKRGHGLNHPLWSARLLLHNPEAILAVHRAYLEAGADCIISASYQASLAGFVAEGLSTAQARSAMRRSVSLACEARDEFAATHPHGKSSGIRPLVAASVGPYGACLADGSEYRGNYGVTAVQLREFHEERLALLAESPADLLACETIPSASEAEVLLNLLAKLPGVPAWLSFSCRDGEHISDGTPLSECAAWCKDAAQIVAVGINCTAPRFVTYLVGKVRAAAPGKAVAVYPNLGERYDSKRRQWSGDRSLDFAVAAREWRSAGASLIGGCCRTGPEHIRAMRRALLRQP